MLGVSGFKNYILRYLRDVTGSIMPMTALMLPLLLGGIGMGVDVSLWMMDKRNLQSAADAAAIAAAYQSINGADDIEDLRAAALREADKNGYDATNGTLFLNISGESGIVEYQVILTEPSSSLFSALIFTGSTVLSATATSQVAMTANPACLVALGSSGTTMTLNSKAEIDIDGCSVYVNSNSNTAVMVNSNAYIDADDICIVGDYRANGTGELLPEPTTDCDPYEDPYADLEQPTVGNCDYNHMNFNNGNHTLYPGVYCGGWNANSNTNLYLEPGLYIIKDGPINMNSNTTLNGEGVSFFFTGNNGRLNLNSNTEVNISPPTAGDQAGILMFQDRNYGHNHQHILSSNNDVPIDGLVYFPNAQITMNSNATFGLGSSCTQIVANKFMINSNSGISYQPDYSDCPHVSSAFTSGEVTLIH